MRRIDLQITLTDREFDRDILTVMTGPNDTCVGIYEGSTDAAAVLHLEDDQLRALRDHLTTILETEN